MKPNLRITLALCTLLCPSLVVRGQAPNTNNAKIFMAQKLEHSQKVFAAMVHGDFATVEKNATAMSGMMLTLEKYATANIPGYREKLKDFKAANASLISAANARNMDEVSLAYATLTLSCVQCHQALRRH
jgi:cytochrome c556